MFPGTGDQVHPMAQTFKGYNQNNITTNQPAVSLHTKKEKEEKESQLCVFLNDTSTIYTLKKAVLPNIKVN